MYSFILLFVLIGSHLLWWRWTLPGWGIVGGCGLRLSWLPELLPGLLWLRYRLHDWHAQCLGHDGGAVGWAGGTGLHAGAETFSHLFVCLFEFLTCLNAAHGPKYFCLYRSPPLFRTSRTPEPGFVTIFPFTSPSAPKMATFVNCSCNGIYQVLSFKLNQFEQNL